MKTKILICLIILCCFIAGCTSSKEEVENEVIELKTEIDLLKKEKETLEENITNLKIEVGEIKYIVTFNIRQTHFTLDLSEHLKDAMNDISIQIPVDKEYYDNIEIGDEIDDSFRLGSLIMKGSFGNWKVTVENKEIQIIE